jgi:hypothetical protein
MPPNSADTKTRRWMFAKLFITFPPAEAGYSTKYPTKHVLMIYRVVTCS